MDARVWAELPEIQAIARAALGPAPVARTVPVRAMCRCGNQLNGAVRARGKVGTTVAARCMLMR
jgi:hypothetical protein